MPCIFSVLALSKGDGVEKNPDTATDWFRKAAAEGDQRSIKALADMGIENLGPFAFRKNPQGMIFQTANLSEKASLPTISGATNSMFPLRRRGEFEGGEANDWPPSGNIGRRLPSGIGFLERWRQVPEERLCPGIAPAWGITQLQKTFFLNYRIEHELFQKPANPVGRRRLQQCAGFPRRRNVFRR